MNKEQQVAAMQLEARVTAASREPGQTRRASLIAVEVLRQNPDWQWRIDTFARRTGVRLTRQQLTLIALVAKPTRTQEQTSRAKPSRSSASMPKRGTAGRKQVEGAGAAKKKAKQLEGVRVPKEYAKQLERVATAGAQERGHSARAAALAREVLAGESGHADRVELFRIRTGMIVNHEQLVAISTVPDPIREAKKRATKSAARKEKRERKAEMERRWARGRRAAPGSSSVLTVSGGLPGSGRGH